MRPEDSRNPSVPEPIFSSRRYINYLLWLEEASVVEVSHVKIITQPKIFTARPSKAKETIDYREMKEFLEFSPKS